MNITLEDYNNNRNPHLIKAFQTDSIQKGGEGSKGGKIIGHTKSGKPIYESHNPTVHQNFSSADHQDAAKLHEKLQQKASDNEKYSEVGFYKKQADLHTTFARHERDREQSKNFIVQDHDTHKVKEDLHDTGKRIAHQSDLSADEIRHGTKKIAKKGDKLRYDKELDTFHHEKRGDIGSLDHHDHVEKIKEEIVKGGEGSKGGKVIGHTGSGKPIYDTFHHDSHKSFTRKDHEDAANVHKELKEKHLGERSYNSFRGPDASPTDYKAKQKIDHHDHHSGNHAIYAKQGSKDHLYPVKERENMGNKKDRAAFKESKDKWWEKNPKD